MDAEGETRWRSVVLAGRSGGGVVRPVLDRDARFRSDQQRNDRTADCSEAGRQETSDTINSSSAISWSFKETRQSRGED
jgi:hypothetical protein